MPAASCSDSGHDLTPFAAAYRPHGPSQTGEMVIAVADGVILEHELARERSIGVERDRRGLGELFVAERADRCRRGRAVRVEADRAPPSFVTAAFSAACFAFIAWMSSMVDAGDRLAAGDGLRQLDLDRVDAGDVMHDHADACGRHAACGSATRRR